LQTPLQTGGLPLSPGQRVQLELARALLRQPSLLILDESLDWLDDLPERELLLNALFSEGAHWTLIVVSQSADILSRCDKVYEIRDRKLQAAARPGALV
jgi:ATP-binding cassette subfamily C protein LapB